MKITKTIITRKGDYHPGLKTIANVDVYHYYFASSAHHTTSQYWNPLRDALKEFNLLGSKAAGIPDIYKNASLSSRYALLAGIIDTDGWIDSKLGYRLEQSQSHEKILKDFKEIAESCGINAGNILRVPGYKEGEQNFFVNLTGPRLDLLQEFILVENKKREYEHNTLSRRGRTGYQIERLSSTSIQGRSLTVQGGTFRLNDGCFMNDSSKVQM